MARTFPIGYSRGFIAQAPAPKTGMTATPTGYQESNEWLNGGISVIESGAKHLTYTMNFSGDGSLPAGVDVFRQLASKLYGNGNIYFSDPMEYDTNLLPPPWATPHLAEHGWKDPFVGTGVFSNLTPTATVPYRRQMTYTLTNTTTVQPTHPSKNTVILIPPTHKLMLGFKGTATLTGKIRVQPILIGGALAPTVDLTLLSKTDNVLMNTTFDGATYQAVEIFALATTPNDGSTLNIVAGTARLYPRLSSPVLTGVHVSGHGNTGCRFADNAIPETYVMVRGHYKQLSTNLVEVGAWD